MSAFLQSIRATVPPQLRAALLVGFAFMLFLTFDQSHWWRLKPDYAFGWLVPLFVMFIVAERWTSLCKILSYRVPRPLSRGACLLLNGFAGIVLAVSALFFLFGALYRAYAGFSQPGSLAMAVGFGGIFLSLIYFNVPPVGLSSPGKGIKSDGRLAAVGLLLFPALIWILSAPLLTAVENTISLFLLRRVVAVVFAVFNFLGYTLMQEGNVLILPQGRVGVAEACSGIRSLTGCLFAGSFLAAVFLDRFWKKSLLVVSALGLAFFTNLLRSLFLTSWAYAYGSAAIEGPLHDATGFAVLGLTVVCLFCLIPLFKTSTWRSWLGLNLEEIPAEENRQLTINPAATSDAERVSSR